MRSVSSLVLGLALALPAQVWAAGCENGVCPSLPPLPGMRNPALDMPVIIQPRPLKRDAHPYVGAGPVPPQERLHPLTRLTFEIADLKVLQLSGPPGVTRRKSLFHNSVDEAGTPFNAQHPEPNIASGRMAGAVLLLVIGGGALLSLLLGRSSNGDGSPHLVERLGQESGSHGPRHDDPASDLPPLEWEMDTSAQQGDGSHAALGGWDALVGACSGDVMAAAAAIQTELAGDPALAPGSAQAIERALATRRRRLQLVA